RIVLAAWLLGLVALFGLSSAAGSAYSNSFTLPHTDSTRAIDLLKAASPGQSGDTEQIVVATSGGTTIEDPAVQSQVNAMLARVSALPHVDGRLALQPRGCGPGERQPHDRVRHGHLRRAGP